MDKREKVVKWEYLGKCFGIDNEDVELNKLGDKGWELVSVRPGDEYDYFYLKRPKK